MDVQCQECGAEASEGAFFCTDFGAPLRTARQLGIRPISVLSSSPAVTTRRILPTVAPTPPRPPLSGCDLARMALIPLIGIGYAVVFLIGLMQVIEHGGLPGVGLWGVGPVVAGALCAEEDWLNGRPLPGLLGLLVWAALPWALAVDMLPLGAALGCSWLVARAVGRQI
jgi:hypothetical protein